jgi:hypothetical protein
LYFLFAEHEPILGQFQPLAGLQDDCETIYTGKKNGRRSARFKFRREAEAMRKA